MRDTLHRSENLTIARSEDGKRLEFEIRFSSSSARGDADGICPRCGKPGRPTHWEIEGPDGRGNTVWMRCTGEQCVEADEPFLWSQTVTFDDGWDERE